jgi:Flp pilus assembly protein CpaB
VAETPSVDRLLRRARLLSLRHRRPLAAALAAAAVFVAVGETRTTPATPTEIALQPQPGRVALPVRAADAGVVALLRPGDEIDVLGVLIDGATGVVASGVRVLRVPDASVGGGFLTGSSERTLVVLDAAPSDAIGLAAAQAAGPLTLAIRSAAGR